MGHPVELIPPYMVVLPNFTQEMKLIIAFHLSFCSNLSEHKRIHMENRPEKPVKELFCHCGKVFRTQRDLDWHKEGEHEKKPKKCNYCGEVFIHSSR